MLINESWMFTECKCSKFGTVFFHKNVQKVIDGRRKTNVKNRARLIYCMGLHEICVRKGTTIHIVSELKR
jgi:hypothetical protein